MVINGRVRQACSALVNQLLAENPKEFELQPLTKFPVVRDLVVEGKFEALNGYVKAVHELLAAERARWSDTMASAETGIARLQAQLEELKGEIGRRASPA